MATIPRRDFLYGLGSSLGALALTDLQAAEKNTASPLAPKKPMRDARAKAVIMLFMEGGPSQADTFDPKPELSRLHLSESKRTAGLAGGGSTLVVRSSRERLATPASTCPISGSSLPIPKSPTNCASTVAAKRNR
jgi:hypothetical protein